MTNQADLPVFEWCTDPNRADEIATLFASNADPFYISHSEIQYGLATSPFAWASDLRERVAQRTASAIESRDGAQGGRLAVGLHCGAVVAFAFVSMTRDVETPFATLEDLFIVPDRQGSGVGHAFLRWITEACRVGGAYRMFLESGVGNDRAHEFFARHGFRQTSIVMMAELHGCGSALPQ